jgi:O-antigen biosynthesis protein
MRGRILTSDRLPAVAVCVPVWRRHGPPNLRTLAEGLASALDGIEGELVVVLNGIEPAAAEVPEGATTVSFPVNRGVAPAWNAAASASSAEVLCVVNDDVALGPGAVRVLAEALRAREDAGMVGPVGTMWDFWSPRHESWVDVDGLEPGATAECDVVSGFCFATPRSVYEQVGGFDEAYAPCGFEEVDYSAAVRSVAARRCYAVAGVLYDHEFGVSARRPWTRIRWDGKSETLRSISRRNRRHFIGKWRHRFDSAWRD